jgi:hypothetical protein
MWICGEQSDTGTGFLRVFPFPMIILIPYTAAHSSFTIKDWYVTTGQIMTDVPSGLSLTTPQESEKKNKLTYEPNCAVMTSWWRIGKDFESKQLWPSRDPIPSFAWWNWRINEPLTEECYWVLFYKPSLTLSHHLLNVLLHIANKLGLLKTKLRMVGVPAESRTENLLGSSPERYHFPTFLLTDDFNGDALCLLRRWKWIIKYYLDELHTSYDWIEMYGTLRLESVLCFPHYVPSIIFCYRAVSRRPITPLHEMDTVFKVFRVTWSHIWLQ